MPDEQPKQASIGEPTVPEPPAPAHEPEEEDDRLYDRDEPEELPPRPRRRVLRPIPLALLAALLIAGGFIAGVEVQKGEETSSATTGAGVASRIAGLRGAGTTGAGAGSSKTSTGGGAAGGFAGTGGGGARPTIGTVAYLAGSTLYVTNAEGNTVKVNTSAATNVSKTVKSEVKGIHPGETVTITGVAGSSGVVSAESVSVGSSAGGLAALFGGAAKGGTGGSTGTGTGNGGAPLFGSG